MDFGRKSENYFRKFFSESRFESPIIILKLNNYLDFGRKSENYFNVKDFNLKFFQTLDQSLPRNSAWKSFQTSYPNNLQTFEIFRK